MNHKKTYFILIFSIFISVISVLFFVFVFMAVKNKNEHASALTGTINEKASEIENIASLKDTINKTKEKRNALSSYLVNAERIDEFVSFVEDMGTSVGVSLDVSSVDLVKNKKNTISVDFVSKGSFDDMMRLVIATENMPYQVTIKKVFINKVIDSSLDSKGKPNGKDFWELQLGFEAVSK